MVQSLRHRLVIYLYSLVDAYRILPLHIKHKIKFGLVGGSLYILSVWLLKFLTEDLDFDIKTAYCYQTITTYTLQFLLNAVFTWRDRTASLIGNIKRVSKYIPIKIGIWYINQLVFLGWMFFDIHYQIANALTVGTIMVANYFVFDRLIFTEKERNTKVRGD